MGPPASTADTVVVLGVVRKLLRGLLRDGIGYKKSGVALFDLAPPDELQGSVRAVGGRQSEADGHHGPDQPEVRARHGRPRRIWLARAASVGHVAAHAFAELRNVSTRHPHRAMLTNSRRALTSEGAGTGLLRMPQCHQSPVCA